MDKKEITQRLESMIDAAKGLAKNDYNHGVVNGIILSLATLTNEPTEYMEVEEYKELKNAE